MQGLLFFILSAAARGDPGKRNRECKSARVEMTLVGSKLSIFATREQAQHGIYLSEFFTIEEDVIGEERGVLCGHGQISFYKRASNLSKKKKNYYSTSGTRARQL
ncbi:hypothetical protein H0G86_001693 [Trichoderma simmonsii]|uniref:Uncharacterized protein n=1 Tax=Trichoderma simmonsii TaxID=1491479 RepID=A0A8G0L230_9HYPO|nr:hypothetical protein H0G86_001693 [Trichoderma simmonsii]